MIAEIALATALLSQAPEAKPDNRYLDSGNARVWRGVPPHAREVWFCIRRHESIEAGHWTAANPRSSASGAGQWLDSTWRSLAKWIPEARPYSRAKYAPPRVQDLVFVHVYNHHGLRMWHGTWCPGT